MIIKVLFKLFKACSLAYSNVFNRANTLLQRVAVGTNVRINGRMYLNNRGRFSIGDNVVITSSAFLNPVSAAGCTKITVAKTGGLAIGEGTMISNTCIFCANSIIIGRGVRIGAGCTIFDTDFHSLYYLERIGLDTDIKTSPVEIGDFAFIGAQCMILKGVKIGCRSIIAAGAVVVKSVPDDQVWGGNPARFLRTLKNLEVQNVEGC